MRRAPPGTRTTPRRNSPAGIYLSRIREIDPAITCESARWGDARRPGQPYTRNAEWQAELDWLLLQYFPRRTANVLGKLRAGGLYPAVGAPLFNRKGGAVPPGFMVAMTLPAGTAGSILYTVDGADPRSYWTGEPSPGSRVYSTPIPISDRVQVKARVLQNAVWSALSEAIYTLDAPLESLRITEIMYHPPGGRDLEFLELENSGQRTLDLSGLRFAAGIASSFPAGAAIGPGEYLVLAANPEAFSALYPDVPVGGTYSGSLDNAGERITLEDSGGNAVLTVDYDDERSWPVGPDGFGHSLVLGDAGGALDDPRSWRASAFPDGSPGGEDPAPRHRPVLIGEVLARATAPLEGAIELWNPNPSSVAIGGWFRSDRRDDAAALRKFRIPPGASLPAFGRLVIYEAQFNAEPGSLSSFSMDPRGGAVYLSAADAQGNLTGQITGMEHGPAPAGVSFGAVDTSTGGDFALLAFRTFGSDSPASASEFRQGGGAPNSPPRTGEVVLNEIRFEPPPGEAEFVELHNPGGTAVALHDPVLGRGFELEGLLNSGGTGPYEFGPGASIPAGGYLLLVGMDPAAFRSLHGIPAQVQVLGPPGGALDNGGKRLTLRRPQAFPGGEVLQVVVDMVRFDDRAPWPAAPAGGEPTLERKRCWDHGNDPANWDASTAAGGTPGARNTVSPLPGANRPPVAYFSSTPGPGPLQVTLDGSRSFDPEGALAGHSFSLGDGATREGSAVIHTYREPGLYTITLRVTDQLGGQASLAQVVKAGEATSAATQVPGDLTQDGRVTISDPLAILGHLFRASPAVLPCGNGSLSDFSNLALVDANGDSRADLSDSVHLLFRLFAGGPPHALGQACVALEGCPAACQ